MFGWLKNRAVNAATAELDHCIRYLGVECRIAERKNSATTITKSIAICLIRMQNEGLLPSFFINRYTEAMNDVRRERKLTDHKNIEYSTAYIMTAFFVCMHHSQEAGARASSEKILVYLKANASEGSTKMLEDAFAPFAQDGAA